jgi:twinkle protein
MSELVEKTSCPDCGSSDARAVYDDGHSFCFSCETYRGTEGGEAAQAMPDNFIQGIYHPIDSRGLEAKTCKKFSYQVGHDNSRRPVHIAEYRRGQQVVGQHVRLVKEKDFFWIGESKAVDLFGQHLWREGGDRLVITEGEVDCLSVAQVFGLSWPVVSIPGGTGSAVKAVKEKLEWISSFEKIVLAFDDDEPGRAAVEKVIPLLPPGKVAVASFGGHKDANAMLTAAGPKALASAILEANAYRPKGVVNGRDLRDRIMKPRAKGVQSQYPKLDEMLMGWDPKKLYLFTAGSGVGKSTLAHEIAHELAKTSKVKAGIVALEEAVEEAAWRHMGIHLNVPYHLIPDRPEREKDQAYRDVLATGGFEFYDHFGSLDLDQLVGRLRYMAVALECKWILLDHISIAVSGLDEKYGENERRMLDKLMTRLRAMIEETGCSVLAIVHLKRPPGEGKAFTEGRQVALSDLRGSASLEQLSDVVVALERDQQDETCGDISTIRLLKNRKTGRVGVADTLEYNPITGRLLPGNAPTRKKRKAKKNEQPLPTEF